MKEEDKELTVVISLTKDRRRKIFSVRKRLTDEDETYLYPMDAAPEITNPDDEIFKNKGYLLAKDLFKINGVESITIDAYDIIIFIGRAFSWEEVEEAIKGVIRKYLYANQLAPRGDDGDKGG